MATPQGDNKQPMNPLLWMWRAINTLFGILGLASMIQNWVPTLVAWKGFISTVVSSYRRIVEPVMGFVFAWLPFSVPNWIGDYLVLGVLVFSSVAKAGFPGYPDGEGFGHTVGNTIGGLLGCLIAWPLFVSVAVLSFIPPRSDVDRERDTEYRRIALWLAAILLGTTVLLGINAYLVI